MKRPHALLTTPLVCCASLLTFASTAQAAGAWSQQPGEFYAKIWNSTIVGQNAYTLDGDTLDLGVPYSLISLDYYAEVGLGKKVTLLSTGKPLGHARFGERRANFLGPLELGLRKSFSLPAGVETSLEAAYGFQGLTDRNLAPSRADYIYAPTVPTQHVRLELAAGRGFSWGWVTGSAGAKLYSNETISPAIIGFLQGGYQINARWQSELHLILNRHTGTLDVLNVTGAGESNYFGFGFGFSYWVSSRFAFNFGADGGLAQSNAAAPSLRLGFELR